ncbi:MAG: efflux RND transporter permease subunit [Phycisphaerae bacterium]
MSALRAIIAGGVRNPVSVNLLMCMMLVGGIYSAKAMVREAFPEFRIDYILVEVPYPGASPSDVEQGVCIPIEEVIAGIDGVREVASLASENVGTVWVALKYDVDDVSKIVDDVKERVDQISHFPPETEKPIVREMVLKAEVINIAIHGHVPERTLKRFAQDVQSDLRSYPEISQVELAGVRDDEITIEVSETALLAHSLSMSDLLAVIKRSSLDLPAGTIKTAGEELTLRVTGQRYTAAAYEDLVVVDSPDAIVRLSDIGTVRETFEEGVQRGRFNGEPAVLVSVFKTPSEDSAEIAQTVRDYVAARQAWLPDRLSMTTWGDTSVVIDSMLSMLARNGIMGIGLVFCVLLLFMDLRTAGWVALGIPVSFAGALIVMHAGGETVNLISIFALIMVSGIIVDDAIVLADSVHARRRSGDTPELAAINGAHRVALPVLGASVTTIATFIPLLFVVGVMGRFIHVLPVVVIAAIAASAIEAFLILPTHLKRRSGQIGDVPREPTRMRRVVESLIDRLIKKWYRAASLLTIRYRLLTLSVATAALLVMVGLVAGDHVPLVLLPEDDSNVIRARVRLPEGVPAETTRATIERIQKAAYALNDDPVLPTASGAPLVRNVWALTGGFSGFVGFVSSRGDNLCEVRVELLDATDRQLATGLVLDRWRQKIGTLYDTVEFKLERQQLGPTQHPIEIRLLGGSVEDLAAASSRVQQRLAQFAGVGDPHDDLIPGKRELRVRLRPAARLLGLTLEAVGRHLRQGFFGGEAVTLQRGREQVKVRVRYPASERRSIADLENERIETPLGDEIPFCEVADVAWGRSYANISRQDGKRRVVVSASVDEHRANANQILSTMGAAFLPEVVGDYNDMAYQFGGDRRRLNESMESLSDGFLLAVFGIYAILASLLRSYVQPLVIVVAVPFGMIGVVVGHLVLGLDLTLMSLFGAVALSGVVVNDSLVLVDQINYSMRGGASVLRAVVAAGETRFRAVVLTSITTVVGLLPLLLEHNSRAKSVMPMAVSLSFGIAFATLLTLFVVPASFLAVNDLRRLVHWLRHGGAYPKAERVEEAVSERPACA